MIRIQLRPEHFPYTVAAIFAVVAIMHFIKAGNASFAPQKLPPDVAAFAPELGRQIADLTETAELGAAAGSFVVSAAFICVGLVLRELRRANAPAGR